MINSRDELKEYLKIEKALYIPKKYSKYDILSLLKKDLKNYRWKYVKSLRFSEYYYSKCKRNIFYLMMYIYWSRKKNLIGRKLGVDIKENVFDQGLLIHHTFGIVINSCARVGKNCILHGNNVIGNMGEKTGAPIIGDNVRLGIGSKVLGDIYIANNVQIGAGAVVIKSCYQEGALLVGVPAHVKEIKGENQK